MRVLITNTSRMWGGTEQYVLSLGRGLQARGHAVRLLYSHEAVGRKIRSTLPDHGKLGLRNDADLIGVLRLLKEIRSHRADIVLLTKWREYLLGGIAARLSRRARSVVSLGLRVELRDDFKRRLIFRQAAGVLVNAAEIGAALRSCPWIEPRRIHVIHNGIDLERFASHPDGGSFRHELAIPPGAPLLVNIGALTPQKDQETLLKAFGLCARVDPRVHLVVVGDGFLAAALHDLSRSLGLDARVHFVGFQDDVRPALAAADLFVLSSDNEGMPWVMLEAMGAGLPIVATDVSGTRACVDPGVNGLVVPPADPAALAAAVKTLLADTTALTGMGAASRRLVRERFDERRLIDQTEKVFLELIAS